MQRSLHSLDNRKTLAVAMVVIIASQTLIVLLLSTLLLGRIALYDLAVRHVG